MQAFGRMAARTFDRDDQTTWATRLAQYDAVCDWGTPNHARLEGVSTIKVPVFVTNGDSDPMILRGSRSTPSPRTASCSSTNRVRRRRQRLPDQHLVISRADV